MRESAANGFPRSVSLLRTSAKIDTALRRGMSRSMLK
jgi:hypothetical protein